MENSGSESKDLNFGCGSEISHREIILDVQTTTGGTFYISVDNYIPIEELKRLVAHKLRVCKDKISLLHRERILQNGTLSANGVTDGSRIVLLPNVEAGLLTHRSENTVMHALESLNEAQVTDFLSGKAPLNLTMRLGDHMMLIQLQLSTMNPILCSTPGLSPAQPRADRRFTKPKPGTSLLKKHITPISMPKEIPSLSSKLDCSEHHASIVGCTQASETNLNKQFVPSQNIENAQKTFKLIKTFSDAHQSSNQNNGDVDVVSSQPFADLYSAPNCDINTLESSELDQSPIKSLSNLVSSPLKSVPIKTVPLTTFESLPISSKTSCISGSNVTEEFCDPICENLTSCLCNSLQTESSNSQCTCQLRTSSAEAAITESNSKKEMESRYKRLSALLHKTAGRNVAKSKIKQKNMMVVKSDNMKKNSLKQTSPSSSRNDNCMNSLAEASRNLTKTLKKLSKDVLTSSKDVTESTRKSGGAAVIDSMKHHGKGIYSGTFSGTLNPALQDKFGRPKRDVTTIIHILNDLLCSSPQYKQEARVSFEPASMSTMSRISSRQTSPISVPKASVDITDPMDENTESTSTCYDESISSTATSTSLCSYGECDGHYSSSTNSSPSTRCMKKCVPSRREEYSLSTSSNIYYPPRILSKENYMTKCKVQQLKLIMQERKQRREFRKMKLGPYTNPCSLIKSEAQVPPQKSVNSSTLSDNSAEEIDTLV